MDMIGPLLNPKRKFSASFRGALLLFEPEEILLLALIHKIFSLKNHMKPA
jgi:hypothetical protein